MKGSIKGIFLRPARPLFALFLTIVLTLVLAATAVSGGLRPWGQACWPPGHGRAKAISVMTRNLYLGADIMRVLKAAQENPDDPIAVPKAVGELFQTVQYTNFPERAQAIAREIRVSRPDIIALQEVSTWLIQEESDFMIGNPQQAETVVYDYLQILLDALSAQGLEYEVAAVVTNADIELPMLNGIAEDGSPIFSDLRLVDHDAVLVRRGIETWGELTGHYQAQMRLELAGMPVEFTRGYILLNARVNGMELLFANTHLEVGGEPGSPFAAVQAAQMAELLSMLNGADGTVILAGDLNSSPEDAETQPYHQAIAAGFLDSWEEARHIPWHRQGYTCCFNETLDDWCAELTERIDHIFIRPGREHLLRVRTWTTGDKLWSIAMTGLWPSDHAGVAARFLLKGPAK
jgi:endonuclease/exonuclease/phosphatase family metal-dependent hydrolase